MTNRQLLERITLDPKEMTGKPVIRGTRLTSEKKWDRLFAESPDLLAQLANEAIRRRHAGEDKAFGSGPSVPVNSKTSERFLP